MPEPKPRFASVNEQLVGALRDMILDGTLAAGAPLPEARLAEYFGVSRNTFRGAIRALAHEGLVRQDRHKTATVFEMTVDDAADLYTVRRVLELTALDRLENADPDAIETLDRAYGERAAIIESAGSDWTPIIAADLAFHRSIVGLHRSPRLLRAFDAIKSELVYCLALLTVAERRANETGILLHEFDELHTAVLAHDSAKAHDLLSGHLDFYDEEIRRSLTKRSSLSRDNNVEPRLTPRL